jgi:hypothetical protein
MIVEVPWATGILEEAASGLVGGRRKLPSVHIRLFVVTCRSRMACPSGLRPHRWLEVAPEWRVEQRRHGEGENISLALLLPGDKAAVAWAAQVAVGQ